MTTLYFESLGCARNQVDSEVLIGELKNAGCTVVPVPETAEVIVVNTCSFIEDAANESIDAILSLAEYKTAGACRCLIVIGCLPQRYPDDIEQALPEVDLFLGTGALDRLVPAVLDSSGVAGLLVDAPQRHLFTDYHVRSRLEPHSPSAYLKIADGCDRRCTYCIIPKLRGRQRSRPEPDILDEARRLIAAGVKELVLVAQETSFYGSDLSPGTDLSRLLTGLSGLSRDVWIRVLYGHPQSISHRLIKTIASHDNLCSYFDMPVQHASDRMLRRMGRTYTRADVLGIIDAIRRRMPEAALRTTVITGFPGETTDDFRMLTDFIETARFHHVGAFVYSDAEDLPSHRLPRPVSKRTARRRYDRIMSLQQRISRDIHEGYVGTVCRVLVESAPEKGVFVGRTAFQAPEVDGVVYIRAEDLAVGSFVDVKIIDAMEYDLMGETA